MDYVEVVVVLLVSALYHSCCVNLCLAASQDINYWGPEFSIGTSPKTHHEEQRKLRCVQCRLCKDSYPEASDCSSRSDESLLPVVSIRSCAKSVTKFPSNELVIRFCSEYAPNSTTRCVVKSGAETCVSFCGADGCNGGTASSKPRPGHRRHVLLLVVVVVLVASTVLEMAVL